jgi:hypothetical protein
MGGLGGAGAGGGSGGGNGGATPNNQQGQVPFLVNTTPNGSQNIPSVNVNNVVQQAQAMQQGQIQGQLQGQLQAQQQQQKQHQGHHGHHDACVMPEPAAFVPALLGVPVLLWLVWRRKATTQTAV